MEPLTNRVKRFNNGHPTEIIDTILNSIDNFFNNEIRTTIREKNYQTSLLFLGIHAVALTISESFFDKNGLDGYKLFLEKFVDGNSTDTKFSKIAKSIHSWRNVLAHQWLWAGGYNINYDYTSAHGWKKINNIIVINPKIYCECYLNAFSANGRIWNYRDIFSDQELQQIKNRLLKKFNNLGGRAQNN